MGLALGNMNVGKVAIGPYNERDKYPALGADLQRQFWIDEVRVQVCAQGLVPSRKNRLEVHHTVDTVGSPSHCIHTPMACWIMLPVQPIEPRISALTVEIIIPCRRPCIPLEAGRIRLDHVGYMLGGPTERSHHEQRANDLSGLKHELPSWWSSTCTLQVR